MTEPDEALLWAREQAKQLRDAPNDPTRNLSAEIDVGMHDAELSDMAHAYRAGAAASAERIKELDARVAELEGAIQQAVERLQDYADMTVDQWGETVADGGITAWMVIRQELRTVVVGSLARAFVLAGWP